MAGYLILPENVLKFVRNIYYKNYEKVDFIWTVPLSKKSDEWIVTIVNLDSFAPLPGKKLVNNNNYRLEIFLAPCVRLSLVLCPVLNSVANFIAGVRGQILSHSCYLVRKQA